MKATIRDFFRVPARLDASNWPATVLDDIILLLSESLLRLCQPLGHPPIRSHGCEQCLHAVLIFTQTHINYNSQLVNHESVSLQSAKVSTYRNTSRTRALR